MDQIDSFKITEKHYATIIKQGTDNLPYETGGFLGGKDGIICGLLPTFNKDWDQNKDVYALHDADIHRAYEFFNKHNLTYYGVYHTHPKGIAYPSDADIATKQQYHFIIAYKDPQNPVFNAFRIEGKHPIQLPLKVIPNKGYTSIIKDRDILKQREQDKEEAEKLSERIHNVIEGQKNIYKRMPPKEDITGNSDFSTLA